ncbi:hypothetical protein [Thermococcus sp. 21S9]|uniref:hypothetical protein n=1 Tax=Thermococcus sp. 21S9 TaxID=1638223 RepID=UPI00143A6987|nr:hypothetical protein [Thermococcus sp. 21S9]NJE55589.1 hypothetical protein [Thermococcus sp. 21S9]
MRKLAVLLIVLSLVLPHVSATELTCQKTLPPTPSDMYCNLTGQGNLSVRVVAFDNISVMDRYYSYGHWVKVPGKNILGIKSISSPIFLGPNSTAEFRIDMGGIISTASSRIGLDSSYNWIFNGKENYITFEIVHSNGTVEKKTIEVFIEGGPKSPLELDRYTRILIIFLALYLAIVAVWEIRRSKKKRKEKSEYNPSRLTYMGVTLGMVGPLLSVSPWLLYYLGTPTGYYGDFRLYLSTIPLITLTLYFLADFWKFKREGRAYVFKNPPVTGVEWITLTLLAFNPWYFPVVIGAFFLLFVLNLKERLNRLMRLAGLISPLWAFYLAKTFGGDAVFKYSLIALAVLHVALINWVVMNIPKKPKRSPGVE